ncbi:glycoside hydrolase family 76 protein [Poronia punctata]|nr:glycoside hydrolase family 76 protein [Poronia punctata]
MQQIFATVVCIASLALGVGAMAPTGLDINDPVSIRSVASTIAYGTMSYYTGNITNAPETIGIFPPPHYWWQAGACWGAMLDYSHYTGETSYDSVTRQALLSQVGPQYDFMVPRYHGSEGNDDQAFWAFAILDAAEHNFPQPDSSIPPWLKMAENIWNSMVPRWDDTSCGGGLRWQIFADNPNGLDYKAAVANGGFFQMSARLARATGNDTYLGWAEKVWDWSQDIGLINKNFDVLDGASSREECKKINPVSFSYSQGIYMYGAAMLFNHTGGNRIWAHRTNGLLQAARSYFSPFPNATNIMYEHACEPYGTCNTDMKSFKGYLSRFMAKTAQMMPSTRHDVEELLRASAVAAAKTCSGGDHGTSCGQKWYVGGYDGNTGLGQQMTALETVQALLAFAAKPPLGAGQIRHVSSSTTSMPWTTTVSVVPSTGRTTTLTLTRTTTRSRIIFPSRLTTSPVTSNTSSAPPPTDLPTDSQESVAHTRILFFLNLILALLSLIMAFVVDL